MFEIDQTSKGKPCIIIKHNKYRKDREMANKDINWRCLGKICCASARTNSDVTKLISHKDVHTGEHPVTMMSLMSKSPAGSPPVRIRSANSPSSGAGSSYVSLSCSPLVSQQLLKPKTSDVTCQTDLLCLSSTDDLIARVQELTDRQSCLIGHIQELNMQLEAEKQRNNNRSTTELKNISDKATSSIATNTDVFSHTNQITQTEPSPCRTCPILKEETKHLIDALRIMEADLKQKKCEDCAYINTTTGADVSISERDVEVYCNIPTGNRFFPLDTVISAKPMISRSDKTRKPRKQKRNRNNLSSGTFEAAVHNTRSLQVYADSHGRFLSKHLSVCAEAAVKSFVSVQPGAPTRSVVDSALASVNQLSKSDHLVILAGTNDLNELLYKDNNNSCQENVIKQLTLLADKTKHTNVTLCSVLKRFDLPSTSDVHNHVKKINGRIRDLSRHFKHVKYLNLEESPRFWFTRHGLHLNKFGKRKLSQLILSSTSTYRPSGSKTDGTSCPSHNLNNNAELRRASNDHAAVVVEDQLIHNIERSSEEVSVSEESPGTRPPTPHLQSMEDFPPLPTPSTQEDNFLEVFNQSFTT